MLPTSPRALLALTLTAPLLLLAGCATESALCKPTPDAVIPPLPIQARQNASPTFSANASSDIESWLQQLTPPSLPAKPASSPTTR